MSAAGVLNANLAEASWTQKARLRSICLSYSSWNLSTSLGMFFSWQKWARKIVKGPLSLRHAISTILVLLQSVVQNRSQDWTQSKGWRYIICLVGGRNCKVTQESVRIQRASEIFGLIYNLLTTRRKGLISTFARRNSDINLMSKYMQKKTKKIKLFTEKFKWIAISRFKKLRNSNRKYRETATLRSF